MNNRKTKFLEPLKSVMDFQGQQQMLAAVNSLLNGRMTNGQVIYSDSNVVWDNQAGGGSKQDFVIVSDGGDWYNCNMFDGVNPSGGIVKVAKHQDIRCILTTDSPAGGAWSSKTIRGITYTYAYNAVAGSTTDGVNVVEYTRDVTGSDSSSETDYITPCLNVGDIISALPASFAGPATLVGVAWQAMADGRAWAAQVPPV